MESSTDDWVDLGRAYYDGRVARARGSERCVPTVWVAGSELGTAWLAGWDSWDRALVGEAVCLWRPDDQHPWREWESGDVAPNDHPAGEMATFVRAAWHARDGEICGSCGRLVVETCPTYWHAPDALWLEVEGSLGGIRCIPCFTCDAAARGIAIQWRAVRAESQDCWCTWDEIDGGAEGIVRYHPNCPQHPAESDEPMGGDGPEDYSLNAGREGRT